jgi:glycosyltransferase involved in cell wall biosynthesis
MISVKTPPPRLHAESKESAPGSVGHATSADPPKKKLAVVSTYDELCGIAAYTRFLERQLACDFDVTVFDLNQYFLRATHERVRQLGDAHIREICAALPGFDYVNIQLEHGTLGRKPKEIVKRFHWLVEAAPAVSVTFHTVPPMSPFGVTPFLRELGTFKWTKAVNRVKAFLNAKRMTNRVYSILANAQRKKRVSVIVHNRRDWRLMKYVNRFDIVLDHPLSFLTVDKAATIRSQAARSRFPQLSAIPESAKLVGVFGFFGAYKGFESVLRAMHYLPKDHHLLVFGGVHPNEIKQHVTIDPYLKRLLDEAYVNRSLVECLKNGEKSENQLEAQGTISLSIDGSTRDLLEGHPRSLIGRIHFMGALSDEEFLNGMAICDTVVMPYLEVGQSSSGPISQAVELGCRVIASRTHAFLQFAKYHPGRIEFFEIGNYVELASRINTPAANPQELCRDHIRTDTNRAVYRLANSDADERTIAQSQRSGAPGNAVRIAEAH